MKALRFFLLVAAVYTAAAAQQPQMREVLSPEGEQELQQLRLERSKRLMLEVPSINPEMTARLLKTNDRQLIDAALRDQSVRKLVRRNENVQARLKLFNVARLAENDDISAALTSAGIDKG
ncbi:MAG: hypothetical protein WB542_17630, partial [Polaromonas sp.]